MEHLCVDIPDILHGLCHWFRLDCGCLRTFFSGYRERFSICLDNDGPVQIGPQDLHTVSGKCIQSGLMGMTVAVAFPAHDDSDFGRD